MLAVELPAVGHGALLLSRLLAAWAREESAAIALWQVVDGRLLPLTFGELIRHSRQIADLLQLKRGSRLLAAAPFGSPMALRMGLLLPLLEPVSAVAVPLASDSLLLGRAIARQQVDSLFLGAWPAWVMPFLLFRLFDIWKPWLVGRADRRGDAAGVMLDDLWAGLFAGLATMVAAGIAHGVFM